MKITFIKQNKQFDLRPGFVIEKNYNEDLDSADVYIDHTTDVIIDWCKILDVVYVSTEKFQNTGHFFVVSSIEEAQVSFVKPFTYQYHLTLVSQTKELEGVILPSLKITQLKDNSERATRTIKYYMKQYLDEYGAKIYKKDSATKVTIVSNKWTINYLSKFDKECPEMQWNNPTFREVITDLAMIVDCIPIMTNNVINFIDLTEVREECNLAGVNQSQRSLSLDDSASELRCELKNVMQSNISNVNDTIEATEYIGFRTDEYLMTTESFKIILSNPILELISVKVSATMHSNIQIGSDKQKQNYVYIKDFDITNLIKEYSEWATLPIWGKWNQKYPAWNVTGQYQEITPYFKRYGNVIENFDATQSSSWLWLNFKINCFCYILCYMWQKTFSAADEPEPDGFYSYTKENIQNIAFKITYRTTANTLFQASKNNKVNSRVIVDNQTSSFVDPYAQGLLEYAKANRLGNTIRVVQSKWDYRDNYIPEIGMKYGSDEIIFKTQTSYYDDFMLVDFYTTPNYVLRNYFTGVQAKLRNWKIVDGNEALERHDLIKIYGEVSNTTDNVAKYVEWQMGKYTVAYNLLTGLFVNTEAKPVRYCFLNINEKKDILFLVDLVSRLVGKSMLFTFGFSDNYEAGRAIKDETISGGIGMNPLSYVDDNGENTGGHFWLTNTYAISERNKQYLEADSVNFDTFSTTYSLYQSAIRDESNHKPIANDDNLDQNNAFAYITFNLHKDNSEITRITTQFEFLDNLDEEIYIGTQFVKRMQQIRTNTIKLSYKAYISSEKPIVLNFDNVDFRQMTSVSVKEVELVEGIHNCFRIKFNSTIYKGYYVYFCDENNNVLLVYKNYTDTATKYLYLNLFEIRDKTIYN